MDWGTRGEAALKQTLDCASDRLASERQRLGQADNLWQSIGAAWPVQSDGPFLAAGRAIEWDQSGN